MKNLCENVGTRDRSIDRSSHNLLSLAFIKVCDELSRRWRCLRIYAGNITSFNLAGSLVRKDQMFAQRSKSFFFYFDAAASCLCCFFLNFTLLFTREIVGNVFWESMKTESRCVVEINISNFVRNCELDRSFKSIKVFGIINYKNALYFICLFSKILNRDQIEIWGQKCFNLKNVVCGKWRNWIGIRKIYICYRFFSPIFHIHPSIFKKFINLSSRRYFVKLSEGKVYKFSSLQHREKG